MFAPFFTLEITLNECSQILKACITSLMVDLEWPSSLFLCLLPFEVIEDF